MSDLSQNKEIINYDETKCPLCNQQYNEETLIPRILLNCGHTICSQCISSSENSKTSLKCPEDNTEYQNISLTSFPINKASNNESSKKLNNVLHEAREVQAELNELLEFCSLPKKKTKKIP